MPPSTASDKKEIRLKVAKKFYKLLQNNAHRYGVKPTEYIIHLILDDIKVSPPPFLSNETEENIGEAYNEVEKNKEKGNLKGASAHEVMKNI